MRKDDGLRPLQMGVAGDDEVLGRLRLPHDSADEPLDETDDFLALPAEIEPHVHRDLIVAAAGGVQLLARLADAGGELRLHEHVDVLRLGVDRERTGLDVRKDAFEPFRDLAELGIGDDAAAREHLRVRERPLDVLAVHPAVHGDGRVEIVRGFRCLGGRPARPHLSHNCLRLIPKPALRRLSER